MHSVFSTTDSNRSAYACLSCTERKVKCDKAIPCNTCTKRGTECIFKQVQPPRKRRKVGDGASTGAKSPPNSAQPDGAYGVDKAGSKIVPITPESVNDDPNNDQVASLSQKFGGAQLLVDQGRTQYLGNSLWSRVLEELPDSNIMDNSDEEEMDRTTNDAEYSKFILDPTPSPGHKPQHPDVSTREKLWETFAIGVDPVCKMVHLPTLKSAIDAAYHRIDMIPKGFEALLFSIYGMAVIATPRSECLERYGSEKDQLRARYRMETREALVRARFMETTSLVTLQAFMLYTTSLFDLIASRTLWTYTGIAMRIAEGMGLHQDGTVLGLPPFETEIRRRVWFCISIHDMRAAELCGMTKFRGIPIGPDAAKPPSNLDDSQLYPTMTELPPGQKAATDMSFMMIWVESRTWAVDAMLRNPNASMNLEQYWAAHPVKDKVEKTQELHDIIELNHLRYCDPAEPLQLLTLLQGRVTLDHLKFLTYHPRRWADPERALEDEQKIVWNVALKILSRYVTIQTNPTLKRYAWRPQFYMVWHPFIHLLDTLRRRPSKEDADEAWKLIEQVYTANPQFVTVINKPIHVAVGTLCLKAWDIRKRTKAISDDPAFISNLREALQSRKRSKRKRQLKSQGMTDQRSHDVNATHSVGVPTSHEQQAGLIHDQTDWQSVDVDNFWLNESFTNGMFDNTQMSGWSANDIMEAWPTPNDGDDGSINPLDWTQWDAWMASTKM